MCKSSAENHLCQLACVKCFDAWVPHKLSGKKIIPLDLIFTCDSLIKSNESIPFLKQIVISDEKAQ